jgi:hypothetical protein
MEEKKKKEKMNISSSSSPPLRFHKTLEESREYVPLFRWQNKNEDNGLSRSPPGSASKSYRRGNSGRVGPFNDSLLDTTSRSSDDTSGRVYIDVTGLEEYQVTTSFPNTKSYNRHESIESDDINFGITSDTLSETATEAYKQATNFGEGILSILGIQSSTNKSNSTHNGSNTSTTPSKVQVSGFLTGVSKSVMSSSLTPIGLLHSTQSSISQSSVTRNTVRRRTGIGGEDLLVEKKEQSFPSVIPFGSSISQLETKTINQTKTTPPNVLLSSSGRRIYLGRSAERVARIKAQKAERTARKITSIEG